MVVELLVGAAPETHIEVAVEQGGNMPIVLWPLRQMLPTPLLSVREGGRERLGGIPVLGQALTQFLPRGGGKGLAVRAVMGAGGLAPALARLVRCISRGAVVRTEAAVREVPVAVARVVPRRDLMQMAALPELVG